MITIDKNYTDFSTATEAPGTLGNPVVVIDAPCGAGKTSWAIHHMQHTEGPFIFVTPFNKEIEDRILPMLKEQDFRQPEAKLTKRKHLIELLSQHHNIACTHELFRQIGATAIELIQAAGYTLILDEVMQVLDPVSIGKKDRQMLFKDGVLELQEDRRTVTAPGADEYLADKDNRFRDVVRVATHDRLALVNDSLLLWLFPDKVFAAFNQVYNLTYLYKAQIQALYYQVHGVEVAKKSVAKDASGLYQLVSYSHEFDAEFRDLLHTNVDVYQGKYNNIGRKQSAFSKSWFLKAKKPLLDSLGKTIRNYCLSKKAKADDVLWSVFGDWENRVNINGFAGGFLACNARATNDYKDKSVLAYCCNRYMNPMVKQWLVVEGCDVDDKAFAASELVQWLCRSRIREGKPVFMYLPSQRMRDVYQNYLNGDYS